MKNPETEPKVGDRVRVCFDPEHAVSRPAPCSKCIAQNGAIYGDFGAEHMRLERWNDDDDRDQDEVCEKVASVIVLLHAARSRSRASPTRERQRRPGPPKLRESESIASSHAPSVGPSIVWSAPSAAGHESQPAARYGRRTSARASTTDRLSFGGALSGKPARRCKSYHRHQRNGSWRRSRQALL